MVIEHFGNIYVCVCIYIYIYFFFLHAPLPSLTIDCNMQLTEGLEVGGSSEPLVSNAHAKVIYILIRLFMNATAAFIKVNQNGLRTPLFPTLNNLTLESRLESSFEN